MRTSFKLSALCITASLILASCGGPSTPDKGTNPNPMPDSGTTSPVTGGTIARPADSTAANEFIITGVRAKVLAQSLGLDVGAAQNVMARNGSMQAQATTDAEARARALALDIKTLKAKRDATTAAQVVRSPVAGSVVEIRNKGATVHGLTVEVVILSRDMTQAPSSEVKPGVKNETF